MEFIGASIIVGKGDPKAQETGEKTRLGKYRRGSVRRAEGGNTKRHKRMVKAGEFDGSGWVSRWR